MGNASVTGETHAVLWFRYGELPCAVLANTVYGISSEDYSVATLASVIDGVATSPATKRAEQWVLSLAAGGKRGAIMVDGPCHFGELSAADALAYPAALAPAHYQWLLGFARHEEALALVMSATAIIDRVQRSRDDFFTSSNSQGK